MGKSYKHDHCPQSVAGKLKKFTLNKIGARISSVKGNHVNQELTKILK